MKNFGHALLDQGGTVVASNRIIYVTDHFPQSVRKAHKSPFEIWYEMSGEPVSFLADLVMDGIYNQNERYQKVEIPTHHP